MEVPNGLWYTKEHEWVKIENQRATCGITDFAQHALGDITFVELPKVGSTCRQFKQLATVESVKAASDVYAPVSGTVVKINDALVQQPELLNQSPFDQAWFAVIECSDIAEKKNLLDAAAYRAYLEGLPS